MQEMGIKNVKNISGGMAEWEKLKKWLSSNQIIYIKVIFHQI